MKKILFLLIALCAQAAGAGIAMACDNVCVTGVAGDAIILRGGSSIPVEKGAHLAASDVVKTSDGGSVDLALHGVAGCRVMPSSEVKVSDPKTESMKFDVDLGSAVFNIEKLPAKSTFEVKTQIAVAAVRGTQFMANAGSPGGEGSFVVRDGSVEVRIDGSPDIFTLTEGQAIDIPQDIGGTLSLREASGQELTTLDQASTIPTCG